MSLQHVILCEGYDDRAFWVGWLLRLGFKDLSVRPDSDRLQRVKDPWGTLVTGGQYGFNTASGTFVRLVPCRSGNKVSGVATQFIKGHTTHPVGRLLINLDADDTLDAASSSARDTIAGMVQINGGARAPAPSHGYLVAGIQVYPVIWECRDESAPGIPAKQTLERLASAAIVAAHPQRGPTVSAWLAAEPRGGDTHKHHALSYLAKWYAGKHGSDDFYEQLWRDEATAIQLEMRLRQSGAWDHVEALARA